MHSQPMKSESYLSPEWRKWIAENKMAGFDDQVLMDTLERSGIPGSLARQEVYGVTTDPCYRAGDAMAQRLRKLESWLEVRRTLKRLAPSEGFQRIERRNNVSRQEFLEKYYSANRPVVMLDLMNDWKARTRWTPEFLKTTCGNEMVEIMSGRDKDPRYEVNSTSHKIACRFSEYVDRVVGGGKSNDYYLVANNNLLQREGMKCLYEDIASFPQYLNGEQRQGFLFFWFGPAGTVTPLHHDLLNILMAQVTGRKRITMISPDQTPLLYNETGVYSEVDPERPDFDRFPRFRNVTMTRFVLRPGEVLFVPVGWWHHVEALDISITVSMSNFLFPNQYQWSLPDISQESPDPCQGGSRD
jgi:ribosomal protein L16 Arg81 hydroxylase